MTDTIKRFAEILEQHARIARNEETMLEVEVLDDGKEVVIERLLEALTEALNEEKKVETRTIPTLEELENNMKLNEIRKVFQEMRELIDECIISGYTLPKWNYGENK